MLVLGIETSCDETAVALVDDTRCIHAHKILSQIEEHTRFGGVVPEIAARAHLDHLDRLIKEAGAEAGIPLNEIDGVASTCGPGLIGGVMVGTMMGKALALALDKPFLAINHLEAHALTARLTHDVRFPYLLLLISGGHCQLLAVESVGQYRRYGTTIDDAVGEAFDKVAKLLELGFPGGPAVEKAALGGNATRFDFPQPMRGRDNADFSFSGLKTAIRHCLEKLAMPTPQDKADIAASFQHAVAGCLSDRTRHGLKRFQKDFAYSLGKTTLVAAGGVASNQVLRAALEKTASEFGATLIVPPPALCTDNGAMVAWAGIEKLRLLQVDGLDFAPRPRWPLC